MTKYEYLKSIINNEDLVAHFLCCESGCDGCPGNDYCQPDHNGMQYYLKSDAGEWEE